MKKVVVFLITCLGLTCFSLVSHAEESLLDNNLDLKTDRLNNKQKGSGAAESFSLDEHLFNEEETAKLAEAEKLQEAKQEKEQAELFTKEVPKLQDNLDTDLLFVTNENSEVSMKREETVKPVSSPPSFLPLIIVLLIGTIGVLFWNYYLRKRGIEHGGEQRAY